MGSRTVLPPEKERQARLNSLVGEVIERNLGVTFIMKVKGHRLKAADGIKPRDYEIKVKLDMQKAIRILSSYGIKEFPFEFDSNLSL